MTHTTATDIKNKKVNLQEDIDYLQAKKVFAEPLKEWRGEYL